jgi:hypothetical protein
MKDIPPVTAFQREFCHKFDFYISARLRCGSSVRLLMRHRLMSSSVHHTFPFVTCISPARCVEISVNFSDLQDILSM